MAATQTSSMDSMHNQAFIEPGSVHELAMKAFDAFSQAQYKETQKFLDKIGSTQPSSASSISSEKDIRVQMNSLLNEYQMNKGKYPQKYLSELITLAQDMVHINKAPVCTIKTVGEGSNQTQFIQLGNLHSGPLNSNASSNNASQSEQQVSSAPAGRSASQNPKYQAPVNDMQNSHSALGGSVINGQSQETTNTILLYNVAAMSYQMQQYGQAMSYIIEIMKNMDQAEDFLIVKAMFLLLQILFELRQSSSAWPVITFIDMKLKEATQVLQLKQNIKSTQFDSPSETSSVGSQQEESKSPNPQSASLTQPQFDFAEALDETILIKNSFSIINSSYIRKHAVSPKNMNVHEYKILLQSYKAMFLILQNDITQAHFEIKVATELRAKINQDPVKVKQTINEPAQIQHQGLVNNIKAMIHLGQGNIMKAIQNLSFDEKDYPKTHPSCQHVKQTDEHSKHDQAYQKCLSNHPQYYFNNLGVVHLKLQKYNLAIFYFSKALKFLEKSQTGQPSYTPAEKENPTEQISTLSSQKTPEILYNYGLALYKVERFEEAFRCFEKSSNSMKHHPRLWYYMGLCCLHFNLSRQQEYLKQEAQSDLFQKQLSWSVNQNPNQSIYTKTAQSTQYRRFLLTPQGDPVVTLRDDVSLYEQQQVDRMKHQQSELFKQLLAAQSAQQKQSKAQQKKEKQAQQAKNAILPVDSMSLQSAIMYLQNALMSIETLKQNEVNYGIYIKFILRQHAINTQQALNEQRSSLTGGAGPLGFLPQAQQQSLSDSLNDSTDTQSVQGAADENTLIFDFPQNQAELSTLKQAIIARIDKKYENLKKNVNLHLCYLYLMNYDYLNVIKSGNGILRNLNPNPKTRFQVLQYLAEAYCMLGQTQQAIECLKQEGAQSVDGETKFIVDNLANGLREPTSVQGRIVNMVNQSAILMCSGQLEQAKTTFEQVLDSLELKLQTTETDPTPPQTMARFQQYKTLTSFKHLMPGYLVNLLVYFYIKTKNYKMARQLLKSRRFLLDTNHIEVPQSGLNSIAQRARNQSKSLVKSFT